MYICTFCLLRGAVPYFRSAYISMRIRILQFSAKRLRIWHFFFPFFHISIFFKILLATVKPYRSRYKNIFANFFQFFGVRIRIRIPMGIRISERQIFANHCGSAESKNTFFGGRGWGALLSVSIWVPVVVCCKF